MSAILRLSKNPLIRTLVPHLIGLRTIVSSSSMKVLETFNEQFQIGSRSVTLETGERFSNGAVVLGIDETKVISTVSSAEGDAIHDSLPLTVHYQQNESAKGLVQATRMRWGGTPEYSGGRIIHRAISPLFPPGFYHKVQVSASVISWDGKQNPDLLAANATSAALMLSDIPSWGGPIGVVGIGRIQGQFIVNPTLDELSLSDLNLIYACTWDNIVMIDVQAHEISDEDLESALRLAHAEAFKYIHPQIRLAAKAGKLWK